MWSSKPALAGIVIVLGLPAVAAEDLRALEVVGQRGQSLEQTRRDRYECHNWSVEQTGESPAAVPADTAQSDGQGELRRQRIDRAIVGAAVGGAVGGLLGSGRGHDTGEHALVGAAAGAAIGAASAGSRRKKAAAAEAAEPSDYLRALTACLEGRGYSVAMPTAAELTASR
jgi:uncharacterized protein YcfJ